MKDCIFPSFPRFLYGGDYNPEQWRETPDVWDEDMRLMKLAHANEMSVGIFAWSALEPEEGKFDFSWLDTILEKIYTSGGRVLLATPSGARPHWLADKYPEVLRVDAKGQRALFGQRHNHCPTSPAYREKVRIIDQKLAERYGKHPAVLGWHISNEFNAGPCYCETCKRGFRAFLRKKYHGDIRELNAAWWTAFWSHTYDGFEQIEPPSPIGETFSALELDWRRFRTEAVTDFLHGEVAAVRRFSDLPVTANLMEMYTELDYGKLKKELDFVSWDSYPTWHPEGGNAAQARVASRTAFCHARFRAMLDRPFLLMESTPSLTNWQAVSKLKRPGMNKLAGLQAVAHGSDSVLYFQFRKSRGSNEKFHGAIVDHEGTENNRVFREVADLGATLEKLSPLVGTAAPAKVAVVFDTENAWALELAQGFRNADKKYKETCLAAFYEIWKRGVNADVIDAHDDFTRYDVILAPMLYSVSAETAAALEKFVREGGTLLAGYTLGMVDENDLCHLGGFPGGGLRTVFGVWNEEIDTLYPSERNAVRMGETSHTVQDYCERIHPAADTEVLAVYERDFYANEPAVTRHPYGCGVAYYVAARDEGSLTAALLDRVFAEKKILPPVKDLPEAVSAHTRTDGTFTYLFLENYRDDAVSLTVGHGYTDAETGDAVAATVSLPPFSAKILKIHR